MTENNVPFCVDEDPYCVWDDAPHSKNLEFIEAIRPEFFSHLASVHERNLTSETDALLAATALRVTYAHAVEAALAFVFAALQAPLCTYGWLGKYRAQHLDSLCQKVNSGRHVLNRLRVREISWRQIVERIFLNAPALFSQDDTSVTREQTIEGFTFALERIAHDYLDEDVRSEYNAFKHGFRASPGGFSLAMRPEKTYGKEDPEAPLTVLGASKYGSRTLTVERIGSDKQNLRVEMRSLNWDAHALVGRSHIVAAWISCVKACLIAELSQTGTNVTWGWLGEPGAYRRAWSTSVGVPRVTMRTCTFEMPNGKGPSPEEIRATYRQPEGSVD
jgi:hypothetical protein